MPDTTNAAAPKYATGGKLGSEAGRANEGKRIVHTMDPDFFVGIGRVSAFGAKKYHMRNFLMAPGMAWGAVFDSLVGHLMAHWGGEDLDEESGQPHILHAGWNLMVLFTYWKNPVYHPGDDRPSKVEYSGRLWTDWKAAFDAAKDAPVAERKEDSFETRLAAALLELEELGFKPTEVEGFLELRNDRSESPIQVINGYAPPHEVRDPIFFNDPVRAFLAAQKGGNKP